uniref:Tetratricopeptide repeat protein n=1 Tax=Roseihalotalea indica TaxID=2867963 RepID=A0AA49GL57_9BACT|nr:tetratricopeptide repeat protein [Tunicatimonas sp. TK19036]
MKHILLALGLTVYLFSAASADDKKSVLDSLQHKLAQHPAYDTTRVNLLNTLGYEYWIVDPVQSVGYGQEALTLADSLSFLPGKASAQRVLGVAHWAQGNYERGLTYLIDALVGYQTLNDSLGTANVLMNTGLIYYEQKSYEEALAYFEEAHRTFEHLQKSDRQVHTALNIGEIHQLTENYPVAREYFEQSLHLSDTLGYIYGLAKSYFHLGQLSLTTGELDQALQYCLKALSLQDENGDVHGKSLTYYVMGRILSAQKKYSEAEKHLQYALQEATRVHSRQNLRDIYLELKKVAQATGNYQQAIAHAESYVALRDSLLNAEKLREIVRLENRYALAQKDQELLLQQQSLTLMQQEAHMQAWLRNGLLLGLAAVLFIGYLVVSRQRLKIKKNQEVLTKNRQIFTTQQALAQAEVENAQLKQQELLQQLEYKNKELTSYTINFIQKNELMEELQTGIQQLKRHSKAEVRQQLNTLSRLVDQNLHIDREWEDFKRHFEEVHKDFFTHLKSRCPELSANELKLCALLKLNMSMKEMAGVLGISPDSVKTARYRLRKKLGLDREEGLVDYILHIEHDALPASTNISSSS